MSRLETLRAQLHGHTPSDASEREHLARMQALLSAKDPWNRLHFEPGHFTASAFVQSPDRRALLLIHHRKLGRWLQPGGHIEPGDADLAAAARRELLEEAGLRDLELERAGIFDLDVHAIPALGDEPRHEHFDVRFLFRARTERLHSGDEVKDARWFALGELDETLTDASVMRVLRKLGR